MMYTLLYMPAVRTQIYLTAAQRARIDELRRSDGRSLAEVVRAALDVYLEAGAPPTDADFRASFGSSPRLEVPSRDEWDRA